MLLKLLTRIIDSWEEGDSGWRQTQQKRKERCHSKSVEMGPHWNTLWILASHEVPGWFSWWSVRTFDMAPVRSWSYRCWNQATSWAPLGACLGLVSHSLCPSLPLSLSNIFFLKVNFRGTWVAQSVKGPTSAQVMTSQFVSSSPALGSVLTARSLKSTSDSVSPSLCSSPTRTLSLSLSQK